MGALRPVGSSPVRPGGGVLAPSSGRGDPTASQGPQHPQPHRQQQPAESIGPFVYVSLPGSALPPIASAPGGACGPQCATAGGRTPQRGRFRVHRRQLPLSLWVGASAGRGASSHRKALRMSVLPCRRTHTWRRPASACPAWATRLSHGCVAQHVFRQPDHPRTQAPPPGGPPLFVARAPLPSRLALAAECWSRTLVCAAAAVA